MFSNRLLLKFHTCRLATRHTQLAKRRITFNKIQQRSKFTFASNSRAAQVASTAGNALLVGSVVTLFGYIGYTLYGNLIADNGVTRVYNQSLDLVRAHPQIREIFGTNVKGFGEPTHGQRQRQRAISHQNYVDEKGRQRLYLQYYIQEPKTQLLGVVKVDMAESATLKKWDFNLIAVDLFAQDGSARGRIDVLVTDEFAHEVKEQQAERRNQVFSKSNRAVSPQFVSLAALVALASASNAAATEPKSPGSFEMITPAEIEDAKPNLAVKPNKNKLAAFMASYLGHPVYEAAQPTQVDISLPSDFTLPPGESPEESPEESSSSVNITTTHTSTVIVT
ncbi:mitochondrial import inner membrane translocase subunit tim21, partial [Coemansia brasiliensis]